MKRSQTLKKIHENMSNEILSESRQLLNRNTDTSNERLFITSISTKSLIDDSNDLRELYAFSLSEIQVKNKKEDEEEEEMILRMKEEIDDVSDETRCFLDCSIFCRSLLFSVRSDLTLQLIFSKSSHISTIHVHSCAASTCRHRWTDVVEWHTSSKIFLSRTRTLNQLC